MLVPDHGTVTYQGEPFSTLPGAQRSHIRLRDFGFVFQDGQLLPELPARDNVALPALLTGTTAATALRDADRALERLGLAGLRHRRPDGSPDAPARSASRPLPSQSPAAPSPAAGSAAGSAVESAR